MKIYILTATLLAAFASACTVNMGTPANNGVANSNPPTNNTSAAKTGKSTATDAKETSTKTEDPANSGQSERVEFAAGKTVTNLTRTIPANGSIDFIFNARSGQRMQYSVNYENGSDTDIEAFLTESESQDVSNTSAANENNEIMIKKTGDHRITVNNKTGNEVSINFGLSVK